MYRRYPTIRYLRNRTQWDHLRGSEPGDPREVVIFRSPTHTGYLLTDETTPVTAPIEGPVTIVITPDQTIYVTEAPEEKEPPKPPWPRSRQERRIFVKRVTPLTLQRARKRLGPVKNPTVWNDQFWDLVHQRKI